MLEDKFRHRSHLAAPGTDDPPAESPWRVTFLDVGSSNEAICGHTLCLMGLKIQASDLTPHPLLSQIHTAADAARRRRASRARPSPLARPGIPEVSSRMPRDRRRRRSAPDRRSAAVHMSPPKSRPLSLAWVTIKHLVTAAELSAVILAGAALRHEVETSNWRWGRRSNVGRYMGLKACPPEISMQPDPFSSANNAVSAAGVHKVLGKHWLQHRCSCSSAQEQVLICTRRPKSYINCTTRLSRDKVLVVRSNSLVERVSGFRSSGFRNRLQALNISKEWR